MHHNNLLISKVSSTCFGQILPIFRSVRVRFTACGIVSWCYSRLGYGEWQRGNMCHVATLRTRTLYHML